MRADYLILGAGIIGSAIAYELSRRGVTGIHVIDPDLEGALSSTERNAGGVRHLWQNPVNVELARHSITLFETIKEEIGFQQTGYLWLFDETKRSHGVHLLEHTRHMGLSYSEWTREEIARRYPFIDKTDDLAFGVFGSKDGLINSNALKNYYRNEAKKKGVEFHDRQFAKEAKSEKNGVTVSTLSLSSAAEAETLLREPGLATKSPGKAMSWEAKHVILCAGAWTRELLVPLVKDPLIQPIRRQISVFKVEDFDMTPYGMVVDTSGVYFHPEGGNVLGGFVVKDEKPAYRFDSDSTFFENHIWPALYERCSKFERLSYVTGWGGLYSYTPDTSGILGGLPDHPHIFEAHSFTGRGVMQSYGAALALSDLMLDGKFTHFDAAKLSRDRFQSPRLVDHLPEQLHI